MDKNTKKEINKTIKNMLDLHLEETKKLSKEQEEKILEFVTSSVTIITDRLDKIDQRVEKDILQIKQLEKENE